MSYYLIIFICIIVDQLTKLWIVSVFMLYESVEVIPGFFNLVYVVNKGAAFSMLADVESPWRHYFFVVVGVAAMIGLTVVYYQTRKQSKIYGVALALICGGAAGNLIDRVRFGYVVDFLDFYVRSYHWPAFNVADSSICVGVGLFLMINVLQGKNNSEKNKEK